MSSGYKTAPPGYMNMKDLAELLGKTPKSVGVSLNLQPECLPPVAPNFSRMWRVEDVQDWMQCVAEVLAEQKAAGIRCWDLAYSGLGVQATQRLKELRHALS